jgi:2-keto-4-pentenoate hydratase
MTDDQCKQAAELLRRHRKDGTRLRQLPPDLRPATRAEGYAIQAHWLAPGALPLFGWKIAATSAAGQRHINVDGPLAGRLLAETVLPDGATVSLATSLMRAVEVELAFRLGADLPPRTRPHQVDDVMAYLQTLKP